MSLDSWPSFVNDSGDGQSGTQLFVSHFDAIKASIENDIVSNTNPNVKTKAIIDEVIAARGNLANLDARLSGVIDDDGNFITPASQATIADVRDTLGTVNIITNDDFQIWPFGDTSLPADFVAISGTGTIARTGTGLSDTTRKVGDFAISITNARNFMQRILSSSDFPRADFLKGQFVSLGCWVKTSIASHARLNVADGSTTLSSAAHTGSGNWEWLWLQANGSPLTLQIAGTASTLQAQLQVLSNGTAYFSGLCMMFTKHGVPVYVPCDTIFGGLGFQLSGEPTPVNEVAHYSVSRPTRWLAWNVIAQSNVTGATLIAKVQRSDSGSTFQDIFSASIAAASRQASSAALAGSYVHSCSRGGGGNTLPENETRMIVSQAAGGGGKNPIGILYGKQYITPMEKFRGFQGHI